MNWWDYLSGFCFGLGVSAGWFSYSYTKTINVYKKIVKDYEQMMMHCVTVHLGLTKEEFTAMIASLDEGEENLRGAIQP